MDYPFGTILYYFHLVPTNTQYMYLTDGITEFTLKHFLQGLKFLWRNIPTCNTKINYCQHSHLRTNYVHLAQYAIILCIVRYCQYEKNQNIKIINSLLCSFSISSIARLTSRNKEKVDTSQTRSLSTCMYFLFINISSRNMVLLRQYPLVDDFLLKFSSCILHCSRKYPYPSCRKILGLNPPPPLTNLEMNMYFWLWNSHLPQNFQCPSLGWWCGYFQEPYINMVMRN